MEIIFTIFIAFACGIALGFTHKGINITINHKEKEAPKEYNESLVDELDPKMREYYDRTNGLNKF